MRDKVEINNDDDFGESSASTTSENESVENTKVEFKIKPTKEAKDNTFLNRKRKIKVFKF